MKDFKNEYISCLNQHNMISDLKTNLNNNVRVTIEQNLDKLKLPKISCNCGIIGQSYRRTKCSFSRTVGKYLHLNDAFMFCSLFSVSLRLRKHCFKPRAFYIAITLFLNFYYKLGSRIRISSRFLSLLEYLSPLGSNTWPFYWCPKCSARH